MRKLYLPLLFLMICSLGVQGQTAMLSPVQHSGENERVRLGTQNSPTMNAIRLSEGVDIRMDGILDELVWLEAPVATGFTQREPNDGAPATQRTEVRILYTNEAVFVGVQAFDTAPDSIIASLFRRDGDEASDWIYVSFDSYDDKRTAFTFAVNPRGVQKDQLQYDDTNEDLLWDAVWEAETNINGQGWSAEMRIPLSQLRFSSKDAEQSWGVQFARYLARNDETSFWAPTPQTVNSMVAQYGRLNGIRDLKEPRRLEVIPYISGNMTRIPEQSTSDPYYSRNEFAGNAGGDIKYGLTSDLTLTATINPDFGQVEADPSTINLSAFETYFSERRPFFLEGSDIFQFGRTKTFSSFGNPITFYSRRIGRAPQGYPSQADLNAEFVDRPEFTNIAAAAKVSGKTKSGWSIGFLDAYTLEEQADYTLESGVSGSLPVEPATNYMVFRTKKDINEGNTYFGSFASAVNRSIDNTYFEDFLRSSAYLGGVDFEHGFRDKNWITSGTVSYSAINGSPEAIELAQTSSARYYNRVDSDELSVDTSKTSLAGFATEISIQKRGGDDPWQTSWTYSEVSPGYETNDLGFQNRADYRSFNGGIVYRNTSPERVRYHEHWLYTGNGWNYDGDVISRWYNLGNYVQFNNQWSANMNLNYNTTRYSDRATRGGPVMELSPGWNYNVNVSTNSNKDVSFYVGAFQRREESGDYADDFWGGVTILPTTFIQLSISPEIIFSKSTDQYVDTITDPLASNAYGNRYVFSDINQTTFITSVRLNWTFTPKMSLQTYVRPFISTGKYSKFKEFNDPYTYEFDEYGTEIGTINETDGTYTVDPDGNGAAPEFSFDNPNFNYRSVQGNAVFRWEYMPGSTLFLVWQQQRDDYVPVGNFDAGRDFGELFKAKPTNIFLVKVSYWFGS